MIKRVFIDLDNTIIKDEEEDMKCYRGVLESLGFNPDDYEAIYNSIDGYETSLTEENPFYNMKDMIDYINSTLNKNYPYELADRLNDVIAVEWAKKERVLLPLEVVEYLSSKYDLYIFTNYAQKVQEKRIENIGYRKYFREIFGADVYGAKPFRSSFERAIRHMYGENADIDRAIREILYIGDSKKSDISFARNIGIKSILFDEDGTHSEAPYDLGDYEYGVIHDWKEIMDIL